MKKIYTLFLMLLFAASSFATGQATYGSITIRSPFLNMNKCYAVNGSTTINPQGVVNPATTTIQWGTGTNLVSANTITITNPTTSSYDTTLYVKVSYSSYVLLDTVKLSFVSSTMVAVFTNTGDICVQDPTNSYLDLSCTVTGLGNTSFKPYWSTTSLYCQPLNNNNSNDNNPLQKTYWVYTPTNNIATVTLKNTNGCTASTTDSFHFNLKQGAYSPFSHYDTLNKCGGVATTTYAAQPAQSNVSFAWGGVYSNNNTTTNGFVLSDILHGSGYKTGSVIATNNTNNCVNTYTQVYKVTDISMSIGGTYALPCDGSAVTVSDTNYNSAYPSYLWSLTGNINDYGSFIAGVTYNDYTLTANQPMTVYSIHTGNIIGETGSGTQTCQVNDTIVFIGGVAPTVGNISAIAQGTNGYAFSATATNATVYSWDFGDGSTSSDVAPVHTYTAAGTYTVTLTVSTSNASCGNATTTKTVTVANAGGRSINNVNPNDINLKVYPNPTTGFVKIISDVKIDRIEIYNVMGQIENIKLLNNKIDLSPLPNGIYFIIANNKYWYKIVKD